MHRFLLHNDEIRDAAAECLAPGQVGLLAGWGIFSTLRVYDGVMFAWQRHFERMQRDARRMRVPFPDDHSWMEQRLQRLIEANGAHNSTLRVVVVRNRGGLYEGPGVKRDFDLIAFTVDVNRWPATMKLGMIAHGRHAASEFAGTKYISWSENLTRYERAHDEGLDEVVLLNERGEVSELTSANIFVVHGSTVSTPPLASGCLAGVTRAVLLEEIRVPGLEIREATLLPADLESADQVFITSTTRELLPVASISGLSIRNSGNACQRLQAAFSGYVLGYKSLHQKPVPAV
jgi:branched-chain amino acid aminotransferase